MRRMIFAAVCAMGMSTTAIPARAQVSVTVNISAQPLWGPVGYDYVEYYYLPDLEMYYYVPAHKFVYINGGRWIFASSLPIWYSGYDLYSIHKIVINEPRPYRHFHLHKAKYAHYRGGPRKQVFICNSNDPKYFVVKGHPRYSRSTPKPIRHDKRNGYTRSAKPQPQEKQYRIRNTPKNHEPGRSKQQGGKHGGGKGKGH